MKTVLITGANRGLGFEASKQLAKLGHFVYMGCRDQVKGEEAAEKLKKLGLSVQAVKLDVNSNKDIRRFLDLLKKEEMTLDILINNAGVFLESDGPTDKSSASLFKVDPVIILKTIESNTMGPLKLIQSLVPLMIKQNSGRVINISSGMGQLNSMEGFWPGYRMSKTALNSITRILDSELGDYNIYTNSVCPGWVRTDMGGNSANLSVEEGVETIIWLATCENSPRGKFLQNKKEISW